MGKGGINKRKALLDWCRFKGVFTSADAHRWGVENYYTSADRRVREFAEEESTGIRRIPDDEAKLRGIIKGATLACYEVV